MLMMYLVAFLGLVLGAMIILLAFWPDDEDVLPGRWPWVR